MPVVTYDHTANVYEAWLDTGEYLGCYDTHAEAWQMAEAASKWER